MCRVKAGAGACDLTCCAVDCRLMRYQQKPQVMTGSKRLWLWEVADVAQAAVHNPPSDFGVLCAKLRECFERKLPATGASDIVLSGAEANCLHEIYRLAGRAVHGQMSFEELLDNWGRLLPQLERAQSRIPELSAAA